jgi:hypothetical protein
MKAIAKASIFLFFIFSNNFILSAQQILDIEISNKCIYSGTIMDDELYAFSTNVPTMDNIVKNILEMAGGLKRNFYIVQTNVENVSAVIYEGKRYLLWSQDFLENANRIEAYGSVAHEIGHHLNGHSLKSELKDIEEKEADFFMGFILYKANFSEGEIRDFLSKMPKIEGTSLDETRYKTVIEGFKKSETAIKLKGLGWEDDPSMASFLKAGFPFPPPECHTSYELPNYIFSNNQTLGDVSRKITKALGANDYPFRYMSVPDGFAIVVQMEQYNKDGSIMTGSSYRWVDYPPQESFTLSWNYIRSLIYPKKGYLRMFVFIVTSQSYSSTKTKVSKSEAAAWLSQGVNRLPKRIAGMPFSNDYSVSFLVYEFEVPESNHRPEQSCPCQYQAKEHIQLSGIQTQLGN